MCFPVCWRRRSDEDMNALCAMEAKHCSMSRCDKQTPVVQA